MKTKAQEQMLRMLAIRPIAQPMEDRILGAAKMRTLKGLKKLGLVRVRVWDEKFPHLEEDETWEEWSLLETMEDEQ